MCPPRIVESRVRETPHRELRHDPHPTKVLPAATGKACADRRGKAPQLSRGPIPQPSIADIGTGSPAPAPHTSVLGLVGVEQPGSAARRHTRDVLAGWGADRELRNDAELVVDELVTNAELHAGGPTELWLTRPHHGQLAIAVSDAATSLPPTERTADPETTTGRGLAIIDALSVAHGCQTTTERKTVWALLTTPDPSSAGPSEPRSG
jgi:anti-sigma regulatory factor (Ser/Thr protein kinase)